MENKVPSQTEDKTLKQLHSITLTKSQWIVIFNVLIRQEYRLADAKLVQPIVNELEKVVVPTGSDIVLKKE